MKSKEIYREGDLLISQFNQACAQYQTLKQKSGFDELEKYCQVALKDMEIRIKDINDFLLHYESLIYKEAKQKFFDSAIESRINQFLLKINYIETILDEYRKYDRIIEDSKLNLNGKSLAIEKPPIMEMSFDEYANNLASRQQK